MTFTGNTIMSFEYGSRAHGTATLQSDHDVMTIVAESPSWVTGMSEPKTFQRKTAAQGARSGRDDIDETVYPLRHWARLAAKGNPTVLTALFAPDYEVLTETGAQLTNNSSAFVSKTAGAAYLGYMQSQRLAMQGMRNKKTNRPELVHTHGFDTKFAYHMLRLGYQGAELLRTGELLLPLTGGTLDMLIAVRAGYVSKHMVLELADHLEVTIKSLLVTSALPQVADIARINALLHEIYEQEW